MSRNRDDYEEREDAADDLYRRLSDQHIARSDGDRVTYELYGKRVTVLVLTVERIDNG